MPALQTLVRIVDLAQEQVEKETLSVTALLDSLDKIVK